jgi:hypothetical protein
MNENCPVCNPSPPCNPRDEPDIVKGIRARFEEGCTPNPDHVLMHRAIREIEQLRTNVRSMVRQLDHIGHLGTCMADNVKRNHKIDGGWAP